MKKIYLFMIAGSCYLNSSLAQGWQWRIPELQSNTLKDHNKDLYIFANTSAGISIKKRDLNGNVLWNKPISGGASVTSYMIDAANNLVLVGNITDTATVENAILIPHSVSNFFILKISSSSTVLSTHVYGGTSEASINDIYINANGEYLIGGSYKGNFTMNGTSITGDTLSHFFIVKTDPNQNVLWWETNGYVPGAAGFASITELVETSSGNICAVYQTTGLVDFKGQQDPYDGQFIMELDSSRNLLWRKYQGYCWMGYDRYLNLQCLGDTVYMERFAAYNHSGPDGWINRWIPSGAQNSIYMGDIDHFGYTIFKDKIFYAAICPSNVSWYRHIGFLYSDLSQGSSDSTGMSNTHWNYYSSMECIDSSHFYIGGTDSALGTFVGLYEMNSSALTIEQKGEVEDVIFPNPSTGILNINGGQSVTSVKVYNSTGIEVARFANGSEIDLSAQRRGIYFAELFLENRRVTKKIILE